MSDKPSFKSSKFNKNSTKDPLHFPSVSRTAFVILRNRIFAGMVILLPLILTGYVVMWLGSFLYNTTERWLEKDIESALQQSSWLAWAANDYILYALVVLLSLLLIGSILYLVGLLSTAYFVRRMVDIGEKVIGKIPFISFIYNLVKQISASVVASTEGRDGIKKVVLIEYPRQGIRSVAFATGETFIKETGERFVNLFLPTTPNPTSGFLLILPPEEVWETNLTMEQATKFILSFGIINPQDLMIRSYQFNDEEAEEMPHATLVAVGELGEPLTPIADLSNSASKTKTEPEASD